MKDFITTIASVLILMMFVLQFVANQTTFTKIIGAEHSVKEFRLISESNGTIKSENVAELKNKLSQILKCSISEIEVDTGDVNFNKENGESETASVSFNVSMPLYGIIGPDKILGIRQHENVCTYKTSGFIILKPKLELQPEYQVESESDSNSGHIFFD